MANQDSTLIFPLFHGMGKDDAKKNWFTCQAIWFVKRVIDEETKITQLDTNFSDRALTWYMKYKAIALAGHARSLAKIKHDMIREFQKLKSESQCIKEIKEIKQKEGEIIWDYE
jgi:hypothetical protein